jgi:spore photoproduct lyase
LQRMKSPPLKPPPAVASSLRYRKNDRLGSLPKPPITDLMTRHRSTAEKLAVLAEQTPLHLLPEAQQDFLRIQADYHRFTLQELKIVTEIALDLMMWGEPSIRALWPKECRAGGGKQARQSLITALVAAWRQMRSTPNRYTGRPPQAPPAAKVIIQSKPALALGTCPVASSKTRCCNLLTLDTVDNCGYGCSYCSIQSFFSDHQVIFDDRLEEKLAALSIDPHRIYHIGTGQSSDSLMWGNSHRILDILLQFAHQHPNVILEFKSKSDNIHHLLSRDVPPNVICTWSLNTPTIITYEELGTASLERRLLAARRAAEHGVLVGFHLHPLVHYASWQKEYADVVRQICAFFQPEQVVMLSLGTLTFTKRVLRKIRERNIASKILKLELVESDGKLSYPEETKLDLFSHLYHCFPSSWHDQVFFYLCMENQRLWKPVFGFEYDSNEQFERRMLQIYSEKIRSKRKISTTINQDE